MRSFRTKNMTASGQAYTGACLFGGMVVGTDGTNDPTVTVYDGTDNTGDVIFPSNTYDASVKQLDSSIMPVPITCKTGIYVEITLGAGAVEIMILYRERQNWGVG